MANDNIGSAWLIESFPFTDSLDTSGAMAAVDDPDTGTGAGAASNTVWYQFVAPSGGVVRIDTFGSAYDTVLAVFTGSPGALALVAGNDDADSPPTADDELQSEVIFPVQAGITYYIDLAGTDPWGGQARLRVEFTPGATMPAAVASRSGRAPLTGTPGPLGALLPSSAPAAAVQPPSATGAAGPPSSGQAVPADERYFRPTSFRVGRDAFWEYFQRRGGVRAFGYPVSREFRFLGFQVQIFQRGVLQSMPDGSVTRMNLLDGDLMPYTRINFSTFPRADREMIGTAPSPSDPGYAEKAMAFVAANVVDQWEGMEVDFLRTFMGTVRQEDAFPLGDGNPALIPLMNLEVWGLPTSGPARDPSNGNFVYQRFQRGIMHHDAATGMTQGLLLGDYLKSVITGEGLPPDLDQEAKGSRLHRQQDRTRPGHLARPGELTGTDLTSAFERE